MISVRTTALKFRYFNVVLAGGASCARQTANSDAGFTLAELLVALMILALSTGTLFEVMSQGLRRVRSGTLQNASVSLQQTLVARIGPIIPLQPGETKGREPGDVHWRVLVEPYGTPQDWASWPLAAYVVSVEILGPADQRTKALRVLRLAPKRATP